jgi:hypothetical protein
MEIKCPKSKPYLALAPIRVRMALLDTGRANKNPAGWGRVSKRLGERATAASVSDYRS